MSESSEPIVSPIPGPGHVSPPAPGLLILPSIGRQVWFWKSGEKRKAAESNDDVQPEAATVAFVWNPRLVNLQVVNQNGIARALTSVPLFQPGDAWDETAAPHCQWMPYQVGKEASQGVGSARQDGPVRFSQPVEQQPDGSLRVGGANQQQRQP